MCVSPPRQRAPTQATSSIAVPVPPDANVTIPELAAMEISDYASRSMMFDGVDDYLDVQDFDWNPNSIFTVEW